MPTSKTAYRPGLSVRTSLILLLAGFTTALLVIVYAATTWLYTTQQLFQVDQFLLSEADNVNQAIALPLSKGHEDPIETMSSEDFQNYFREWMDSRLNLPTQYKTTLNIRDKTDQSLFNSNTALELDLRELMANQAALTDQRSLGPASFLVTVRHAGLTYRLVYQPIMVGKAQVGSIRFGCLLDNAINNALDFAGSTAVFLVAAIFLNIGGSIFLVLRVLAPVRQMSETVDQISEENLSERLTILPGRDELSHLSLTFNRALDRIASAYRFQENLVNDLSHQLRTPLTVMRSGMEVAIRRPRSLPEYQNIIEDSLSEIDRLISLINTMLTVAQLEGSRVSPRAMNLQPVILLRNMVTDLEPLWAEKELRVTIDSKLPDDFSVHADTLYLQQAIINILDNARKYTPANGIIDIRLSSFSQDGQPWWRLGIANQGEPIPEKNLERIFERFYRAEGHATDNLKETGFGLGLNIARRIIEMHKGTISARNLPEGKVLFEISLPCTPI